MKSTKKQEKTDRFRQKIRARRAVYKIVTPSAARYAMIYDRYKEADA